MKEKKQLNKNGDKRGMSLNSQKNLLGVQGIGNPKNNHAKKDCSITRIQRGMMAELCPYAKDPTWTWAYALAEAGMKDALTEEKARENLKDRLEGKVTQPIGGEGGGPIEVDIDAKGKILSAINRFAARAGEAEGDKQPEPKGS